MTAEMLITDDPERDVDGARRWAAEMKEQEGAAEDVRVAASALLDALRDVESAAGSLEQARKTGNTEALPPITTIQHRALARARSCALDLEDLHRSCEDAGEQ